MWKRGIVSLSVGLVTGGATGAYLGQRRNEEAEPTVDLAVDLEKKGLFK